MIKQLFIILIVMVLPACLVIGETATKITGEVADQNGLAYSQCSIDLLRIDGTVLRRLNYTKRQIHFKGAMFEQVFIVKPSAQKFNVEIACEGSEINFISEPLDLSGGINIPVNLGSIILKRE